MKIVVVVSEFPKLTETFAYRNVTEYRRRGHDARIFHNRRFRHGEITHSFMQDLLATAFTYAYLGRVSLSALASEILRRPRATLSLIGRVLGAHLREPKRGVAVAALIPKAIALGRYCRTEGVEHIHAEFAGHPATVAMIAGDVAGIPFSFSAHANDIFVSQALLLEKARAARFVRCISDYNKRWLSDLPGFPVDRIRVIRCGVTRQTLDVDLPNAPGEDDLRILYVGSLLKKKGVSHLLDALAMLPRDIAWQARIVGDGDLADDLRRQAERLDLIDRIRFDGPKPAEAVSEAYRDAHVVVAPSVPGDNGRVEGIPVVLMEAMAHGLPAISSALSGIPELIEPGKTGWLTKPGDADAIAAAITDIARDWDGAATIGRAARDRIASDYVIEDNAGKILSLMEEHS